jgi:hypothetical protein
VCWLDAALTVHAFVALVCSGFRRVLHEWGIDMVDDEYKKFWRALDKNRDNTLSFKEFCTVVSRGSAMPDATVRDGAVLPSRDVPVYPSAMAALSLQSRARSTRALVLCRSCCRRAWRLMPAASSASPSCWMLSVV